MGEPAPFFLLSLAPADPEQSAKGLEMRYEITVSFNTSEQLKDEQIDQLLHALRVQIEEPADEYGNDEEYLTSEISLELSAYSCGSCGWPCGSCESCCGDCDGCSFLYSVYTFF
jgi:hypothetical protein